MRESTSDIKELILPDAIELWEKRLTQKSRFTEIFKAWRFRYFALGILIGILLALKSFSVGIFYLILWFILDYKILRCRAKENFSLQLRELKILLNNGFYESDKNRQDTYECDIGKNKLKDSNPANVLRKAWISKLAERHFKLNDIILDAGCKGGEISAVLSDRYKSIFGLDFNHSALTNFAKRFKDSAIQANILHMPLKSKKFDAVLCAEVIEHLYNPVQGLNEVANVIKPNGTLLLSTDNRNRIKLMEILNPLILIERIIGLAFPKVLPPKNLIWKWKERFKIYHSEYSRAELLALVNSTKKFEIISYFSLSFLPGSYKIIDRIIPNLNQEDYLKFIFPIELILAKIPIVKWLGDHWFMILRKI
jgi:ubiquinone/menaquinone biosynthesis C-methylase UbiE